MSILYLSYDGLLEPLGQSQVVQYLMRLAMFHQITVVSYEKSAELADSSLRRRMECALRDVGLRWIPLRYHKRPSALATAYDLSRGFIVCVYLILRYRIQIVHARSYPPALLALVLQRLFGIQFIFDMRGFWADERLEGGFWSRNLPMYRLAKWCERRFLLHADVVVSLTHAAVRVMRNFAYLQDSPPRFEIITTCTDLAQFHPPADLPKPTRGPQQRFTIGWVGSVGFRYFFDALLECFAALRKLRVNASLLILSRDAHDDLRKQLVAHGLHEGCVELQAVAYHDVSKKLGMLQAGVLFMKPEFSKLATAPTRLGEFLACGIPCLANTGIGDVSDILEGERVGIVLREFTRQAMAQAVKQLVALAELPEIQERCVATARKYFNVEDGVAAYARIYTDLLKK